MKKHILTAILAVLFILPLTFCGCSGGSDNGELTVADDTTAGADAVSEAAYKARIAYYETQLEELRKQLLSVKEENYISEYEYKERISKLEREIEQLSADNRAGSDIPVGKDTSETDAETIARRTDNHESDYERRILSGSVLIDKYTGKGSTVSVPSTLSGYNVTSIGEGAFRETGVESVVIPDTVTSLGWFTFYGCSSLTEVFIPSSVTSIGYASFDGCPSSLVIRCEQGSYAEAFAQSYGMRYNLIPHE